MKIHAKNIYGEVLEQFKNCLADPSCIDGALMPDAHAGYTLPIGGVMLNRGKIFPAYVGYDIGCGMLAAKTNLKREDIAGREQEIFDAIYKAIPCGEGLGGTYSGSLKSPMTDFAKSIYETNGNQIGTLGGGNHFIEIGESSIDGYLWIIIHSGSRGFGYKIADHYMRLAKASTLDTTAFEKEYEIKNANVKKYNPERYGENLQMAIEKYTMQTLKGECGGNYGFDINSKEGKDYIMDMNACLEFALTNRMVMLADVKSILFTQTTDLINKNHNCADLLDGGLVLHRKGATSAYEGEMGVIPGNMRDGVAIVMGKGNPDFLNCSSHGAGRTMSRSKIKEAVTLEAFQKDMEGITAKVCESTIDESSFAYKNFDEVLELQQDSIEVIDRIYPIINIKG